MFWGFIIVMEWTAQFEQLLSQLHNLAKKFNKTRKSQDTIIWLKVIEIF